MLCSECYKEIIQGKVIQIKSSIFCKKCVENNKFIKKETIVKCYTCSNLQVYLKLGKIPLGFYF
ncbi:MAG: hypothetical protein MRERC_5c004 [Mycoplasmataceae bacterium RC_NB112A]|nr:MAG: hypothetical protein MRERC_5c004 [Mycoplasmataceae bacterium RC_NB112A]